MDKEKVACDKLQGRMAQQSRDFGRLPNSKTIEKRAREIAEKSDRKKK